MKVEGEYIAISELYGSVDGSRTSVAKSLVYNNKKAKHAELNGVVVFDRWLTTLEAFDFTSTASGGNVKDMISVSSYGTDFKDVRHELTGVTFSPSTIPSNGSESVKTHQVVVTQPQTGNSVTVTCTQAAAVVTWTMEATLSAGTASAAGGWVQTSVSWTRYRNGVRYDSGTAYPSSLSGYANVSGSYVSGDDVYVPSAGTSYYTSSRSAYVITSYTFSVGGQSYTKSASVNVYQSANTYSAYDEYFITVGNPSQTTIDASGGTFTFSAKSQYRTKYTYTSGSVGYSDYQSAPARVTYEGGVSGVSPSNFSGQATITVTVGANSGASRSPIVTVTSTSPSAVSKSVQVTQAAKPAVTQFVSWEDNSGFYLVGSRFTFTARLIYDNSVHGKDVLIEVKRGSETVAISTITANGTTYNSDARIMEVTLEARTFETGEAFYMYATYSNTASIKLDKPN